MHTLKSYYWVVKPERENGVSLKGLDINRPSEADIVTIRLVVFLPPFFEIILVCLQVKENSRSFECVWHWPFGEIPPQVCLTPAFEETGS